MFSRMASNNIKYFILTGDPGVGKTTLTKKISSIIREKDFKTTGFYTEEIRRGRIREGFDIITLNGQRGRLARDVSTLNTPVKYKVGKYGVLIEEFEKLALSCLEQFENYHLIVVDEIGKMEFFSEPFKAKIREIFSPTCTCIVLATIPLRKNDSLIESIRNNIHSKVWMVTKENRNKIHEDILRNMEVSLKIT